jgi:hypothetical protein
MVNQLNGLYGVRAPKLPSSSREMDDSGLQVRLTAVWRASLGQRLGADQV